MQFIEAKESISQIKDVKAVEIGGYFVNISSPFPVSPMDLGIPACRYSGEHVVTPLKVEFFESETSGIVWDSQCTTAKILGNKSDLESGSHLIFRAICVAEYQRQKEGKILTHGAGMASPDGRGLLLLGNQGAGKTSIALSLGTRGYSIVGNDQVIFGQSDRGIDLIDGTKYLTIRKNVLRYNLPNLTSIDFPTNGRSKWDTKVIVNPEDVGISECTAPVPLCAVFIVHLDGSGTDKAGIKKLTPCDLQNNLFLSEKFSRHISGIATPLLADDGRLLALSPSFDDTDTLKTRQEIINTLYQIGVYKVWGGSLDEVTDIIEEALRK